MNLLGMGPIPTVDDCSICALLDKDEIDSDWVPNLPISACSPFISYAKLFLSCMFAQMCFICFVFPLNISYIIVSVTIMAKAVFFHEYWTDIVPLG